MFAKVDYFKFPMVEGGKGSINDVVGEPMPLSLFKLTQAPAMAEALLREFSSEMTANDVLGIANVSPRRNLLWKR